MHCGQPGERPGAVWSGHRRWVAVGIDAGAFEIDKDSPSAKAEVTFVDDFVAVPVVEDRAGDGRGVLSRNQWRKQKR